MSKGKRSKEGRGRVRGEGEEKDVKEIMRKEN